jgi:hypothetical protein
VAVVIVALGAVNHGLLFDIDVVAGTWTAVSLFWVAVVTAGVVLVTGLVAAFLAASGATAARRKLEKELQATYERLRAAEAKLPRPAAAAAVVAVATRASAGEQTAVTAVVVVPAAEMQATATSAAAEDATAVISVAPDVGPAVSVDEPEEQTAVTSAIAEAEAAETAEEPEDETAVTSVMADAEVAETADEGVAHEAGVSPPPAEGADATPPAAS